MLCDILCNFNVVQGSAGIKQAVEQIDLMGRKMWWLIVFLLCAAFPRRNIEQKNTFFIAMYVMIPNGKIRRYYFTYL